MNLGLHGQKLDSVEISYSVALSFSHEDEIRIESPFSLRTSDVEFQFSPGEDPEENYKPVHDLVGLEVAEAEADNSGNLNVTFINGVRLHVDSDRNYEAWTLAGLQGVKVVCMPGGELAIWEDRDQ